MVHEEVESDGPPYYERESLRAVESVMLHRIRTVGDSSDARRATKRSTFAGGDFREAPIGVTPHGEIFGFVG